MKTIICRKEMARLIAMALLFINVQTFAQGTGVSKLVLPSVPQQQWAEAELGAMFSFDVLNYQPDYIWKNWGTHPPASAFTPSNVDTDQWLRAAKAAGIKYAVLVAKHCSGFSLWPTKVHDYSVKSSPWKNGKGDIVADFIASCKKYGIRPGIYYSASVNGYLYAGNPGLVQPNGPVNQQQYNEIVLKQLTELWSNYGKLFEIWFDGGVQPVKDGGPDVVSLLKKLQPDAVVFQGPSTAKNLLRWIGNEEGVAPYPNWSTTDVIIDANGGVVKNEDLGGSPNGKTWCPGETDFPLRNGWQGGWFWKADDQVLLSNDQLVKNYLTSVGRNSNMLIGIVIDTSGSVPKEDVARLKEFGDAVKVKYNTSVASNSGKGNELTIDLGKASGISGIVLREDIRLGERIRKYTVEGLINGSWKAIGSGTSVGNRRIEMVKPVKVSKVRLKVLSSVGAPQIKQFSVI